VQKKKKKRAQVVQHLPSKHTAQVQTSVPPKRKQKKKVTSSTPEMYLIYLELISESGTVLVPQSSSKAPYAIYSMLGNYSGKTN
jgi:hypothetical protein